MNGSTLIADCIAWMPALLRGTLVSMQIAVGAFFVGLLIGSVVALLKLRGHTALVRIANAYTTSFRSIPELLLILLLYYAGSDLLNHLALALGRDEFEVNGFAAAVVVLGVVQGAYVAEILRGAILAIPFGQIEAARALAMPPRLYLRRIVLPAMQPYAIGGLSNLWLMLIKDTALISVVGYSELIYTAKQAAGTTKHYFSFYLLAACIYLLITLASSLMFRLLERRIGRWMPSI